MRFPRARWLFVASLAVLAVAHAGNEKAHAQTTPRIEYLYPAGAPRGAEVEVQVAGEFMPDECRLTVTGKGLAVKQVVARNRYLISVAADAPVGGHEFRLSSVQGASVPFPFVVGVLPEAVTGDLSQPLALKLPITVNGRLRSAGKIDEYALELSAGQQIVCAVDARAFRSPLEAVLRLLDANRQVVATSREQRPSDALLIFRAAAAGRYTLQLFDFQLNGGPQYVYRLTVTDGPWLDYAFPAGLSAKTDTELTLHGWNLPGGGESMKLNVPVQAAGPFEVTLPGGGNRLSLPVSDYPAVFETEPNDDATAAQPLTIPVTINGRLDARRQGAGTRDGDSDLFSFTAMKGQQLTFDVDAAELNSPLDAVLAVLNDAGKKIVEVDDHDASRDPLVRFTAPADGRYLVSVRDRSRSGGDDFIYRLHVAAPSPELSVRVNGSSLLVESGKTANVAVIVDRLNGLTGDFEITAVDLPTGVSVQPQTVPAKTPATITLPISAAENLAPVGGLIRIVARGSLETGRWEKAATIADAPAATALSRHLWLAVGPATPFTLKTTTTILEAPRMAAFPFPVTVERKAGFTGAIRLVGVEPDRRGTVVPLEGEIAAESDQGAIPLVIQHHVTEGTTHRCRVMGVADVVGADGRKYAVFHVAPGAMAMGCEPSWLTLTAEPAASVWRPGESLRVTVRLMRRVAMQPIALRIVPPDGAKGLTYDAVVAASDSETAQLTLQFAPDATLPPRATIAVMAESSRNGLPVYGTTTFRLDAP